MKLKTPFFGLSTSLFQEIFWFLTFQEIPDYLQANVINPKKKTHHFVPNTDTSIFLSELLACGYLLGFFISTYLYSRLIQKKLTHTLPARFLMLLIIMTIFRCVFWSTLPFHSFSNPIAFYFLWSIGGDIFITTFLACGGYFFSLFISLKYQRIGGSTDTMYQVFIVNAFFYAIQTILFFILTINVSLFTAIQPLFFALVSLFSSLFFVILGLKISLQIKKLQAHSAHFIHDFKTARMRAVSIATFFLTLGFMMRAIVDLFWEQDLSALSTDKWYEFIVPFYFIIEIIPIFAILNMVYVKEPTSEDVKRLLSSRAQLVSAPNYRPHQTESLSRSVSIANHHPTAYTTPMSASVYSNSLLSLPTHPDAPNYSTSSHPLGSSAGDSSHGISFNSESDFSSYQDSSRFNSPDSSQYGESSFPAIHPLPRLSIQVKSTPPPDTTGASPSNLFSETDHYVDQYPLSESPESQYGYTHRPSITQKWASFFFPPLHDSDIGQLHPNHNSDSPYYEPEGNDIQRSATTDPTLNNNRFNNTSQRLNSGSMLIPKSNMGSDFSHINENEGPTDL